MNRCCRTLLSKIKLKTSIGICLILHSEGECVSLLLCCQINRCILEVSYPSIVRALDIYDHGSCFICVCIKGQFIVPSLDHRNAFLLQLNTVGLFADVSRGDCNFILCNNCCGIAAVRLKMEQEVIALFIRSLQSLCKVSVYYKVSFVIRSSVGHLLLLRSLQAFFHGFVFLSRLLIYSYIINVEGLICHIFYSILVRISNPFSADCKVQDHIHLMIVRSRIAQLCTLIISCYPVICCKYLFSVYIPCQFSGQPLKAIYMLFCIEIGVCRNIFLLLLLMSVFRIITIMDRMIGLGRILTHNLHDVDLAALRPCAVLALICSHQPECRQISHTLRYSSLCFEVTIDEIFLTLGINTAGGEVVIFQTENIAAGCSCCQINKTNLSQFNCCQFIIRIILFKLSEIQLDTCDILVVTLHCEVSREGLLFRCYGITLLCKCRPFICGVFCYIKLNRSCLVRFCLYTKSIFMILFQSQSGDLILCIPRIISGIIHYYGSLLLRRSCRKLLISVPACKSICKQFACSCCSAY